jgi:hypothetical protein
MKIGDRVMVDPNTQFYKNLRGKKGPVVGIGEFKDPMLNDFIDVRMGDGSIVPLYPEELVNLSNEEA